jgi:hypothetical protein
MRRRRSVLIIVPWWWIVACRPVIVAWRGNHLQRRHGATDRLAQDAVLDQLPLEQGFVTRIFGLHDDPKRGWISPTGLS